MSQTTDVIVPVRRLSPAGEHCFFGYYDLPAADVTGRQLCHRVQFRDHIPTAVDIAELGWLDVPANAGQSSREPAFHQFGQTQAWNFQEGSLLQWVSSHPDTCIYNVFENGQLGSCLHNVRTGTRRLLPLPVANVSLDGTKAVCINMARQYDFRPGYGYEEVADAFATEPAPTRDGVWLMDLASGGVRLILSLAQLVEFLEASDAKIGSQKVVINHITWNPSASRFLLLLRTFPPPGGHWRTFLVTADAAGGQLRNHPVWDYASHYHWRDDDGMLFHANVDDADKSQQLHVISDKDCTRQIIDAAYFVRDGHCSYSPDRKWILYDAYAGPGPDYYRPLLLYALEQRRGVTLGRFASESNSAPGTPLDARCDLHPRWMPDGHSITFDSIHEGYRGVYWADLSRIQSAHPS